MEARATFEGAKGGSRTLIGAVLVVVALGVGAAGGYATASLTATSGHAAVKKAVVNRDLVPWYIQHEIAPAAAEPRLSQDSPEFIDRYAVRTAVVPDWILREIAPAPVEPRLSQDSPEFIAKYAQHSYVPGSEWGIPQGLVP